MNENTKMKILSKAVTFSASGSLVASVNNTMPIIGGEIVELDFLKDGDIVGGYGSLYLLVEREGASLRSSEHNRFIQDQTVFAGSARYDGQPVFGEAFVAINLGSASPAKTMDFAEDTANKPPEPPDEIET